MKDKNKLIYLFIMKFFFGLIVLGCGVLSCLSEHIDKTKFPEFLPAMVVVGTAVAIGIVLYADRLYKRFEWNERETQKMNQLDASLLSKMIWLIFFIMLLPGSGTIDYAYIRGIVLMIVGVVFIAQFIGYYFQLRE